MSTATALTRPHLKQGASTLGGALKLVATERLAPTNTSPTITANTSLTANTSPTITASTSPKNTANNSPALMATKAVAIKEPTNQVPTNPVPTNPEPPITLPTNTVGWAVPGVPITRPKAEVGILLSAELVSQISAAESAVTKLADLATKGFSNDDGYAIIAAQTRLRAIGQLIEAVRLEMLIRIEQSGAWETDDSIAAGRFNTWLARHDEIPKAQANREVKLAQVLTDHLPETRARALAGNISNEQVRLMCTVAASSEARISALAAPVIAPPMSTQPNCPAPEQPNGETYLLDLANSVPLTGFTRLVHRFAHVTDPESDERGYREAKEREYFQLSPTIGGYHLAGFLTEEHGQQVKVAVDNLASATLNKSGDIVSARATRTDSQRRAQSLADLAQLAMDTGLLGTGATERREIVVHVSWTEFQAVLTNSAGTKSSSNAIIANSTTSPDCDIAANNPNLVSDLSRSTKSPGVSPPTGLNLSLFEHPLGSNLPGFGSATFSDGRGITTASQLRRMACDSAIRRIVFGPTSQVLDVGRSQRTVPAHVRTAVIARDKHCVFPNCDEPPQRCEVHHAVTHWAEGGETSVENSALLCWHHHGVVDDSNIRMHFDPQTKCWEFSKRPDPDRSVSSYHLAS